MGFFAVDSIIAILFDNPLGLLSMHVAQLVWLPSVPDSETYMP